MKENWETTLKHQVQLCLKSANNGNLISTEEVELDARNWRNQMKKELMNPGSKSDS